MIDLGPWLDGVPAATIERLTAALDDFDLSSASGALADLGASLPPWAADDLDRLHQSVDGYNYAEARAIASRLLVRVHDEQS